MPGAFQFRTRVLVWLGSILLLAACANARPAVAPTPGPTTAISETGTATVTVTATPAGVAALPTAAMPTPTPPAAPAPYPPPTRTAAPYPYPVTTLSPTPPAATSTPAAAAPAGNVQYLPYVPQVQPTPTPTVTPTPTPTPTASPVPSPTPIPVLDFATLRQELNGEGLALAPVKIGFHTAVGGNAAGLDEWMRQLDAAGVPFFLKSVDNAQPLYFAQELMKESGVPHTLVFRRSTGDFDVPNYEAPPGPAAAAHWQRHMEIWPPELDPGLVWIETTNEVDRTRSEWMAEYALATAQLALDNGFKYAAFGWASGEPEPEHWEGPAMLRFLRLAAQHPDRIAISLHEYSYVKDDIAHEYPYKVGRFQELFRICDRHGIPRPTVLITEWGWTYVSVPPPDRALQDIAWASRLYAPYPQVKGAAIWFLGGGFSNIANQTQPLIYPLMVYALTHYFTAPLPPQQAPINPELYRP